MLIPTVIVHRPNFLGAAFVAYVGDLSLRYACEAAAQPADDIVSELMREAARIGVAGCSAVNFLQRYRRSRVVDVGEETGRQQIRSFERKVSISEHVGVCRSVGPVGGVELALLAGNFRRVKARAHQLENA